MASASSKIKEKKVATIKTAKKAQKKGAEVAEDGSNAVARGWHRMVRRLKRKS